MPGSHAAAQGSEARGAAVEQGPLTPSASIQQEEDTSLQSAHVQRGWQELGKPGLRGAHHLCSRQDDGDHLKVLGSAPIQGVAHRAGRHHPSVVHLGATRGTEQVPTRARARRWSDRGFRNCF